MSVEKVLLLYYHRVNDLINDFNLLCVNQENFRQQMLFLKNNYEILRFEERWENHKEGVIVTFDDGYLDNLENAVPILEELDIPATIFVTTGNLYNQSEFWWDELEDILLVGEDSPKSFQLDDEIYACEWKTDTLSHRKNCYKSLHFLMKNCISIEKREKWLKILWRWKGKKSYAADEHMTLSDRHLRMLAMSDIITIGAHTVSHPSLARLSFEEQEKEIISSIKEIERITNRKIDIFSYPFGRWKNDYNEETLQICRTAGIKKAASTNPGVWKKNCNSLQIPRNCVRNWNLFEFEAKIEEYWNGVDI